MFNFPKLEVQFLKICIQKTKNKDILGLTIAFLDFHLIEKALFMISAMNCLFPKQQHPA